MTSSPSSITASSAVSGASTRMVLPNVPDESSTRPRSSAADRIRAVSALSGARVARSETISIPTIAPRPRMSPMQGNWPAHSRNRAFTRSPVRWARAGIRSASIASSTASAAAQASGFPP